LILSLSGALAAPTVDGSFLAEWTDCPFVLVVDNADADIATAAFNAAKTAFRDDGAAVAERALRAHMPSSAIETKALRATMLKVLERGQQERFHFQPWTVSDAVEFLDPSRLLGRPTNWEETLGEFDRSGAKNLKTWLRSKGAPDFDNDRTWILGAFEDFVPDELVRLGDYLTSRT
jgi:hypothetical protein